MAAPIRYPMPVPEHTRVIWTSAEARALWEPRIARIVQAWEAVERASVDTFRLACRQSVTPEQLPFLSIKAAEAGRALLVLGQNGSTAHYQARPVAVVPGQPFTYTVVLAQDMAAARTFALAVEQGHDEVVGDLLGYPPCCIKFFQQVWMQERWMDTTWPMVRGGENKVIFSAIHPANNILLRWLGVRLVPHLPCSFECPGTRGLGEAFANLLREGFEDEHRWMLELLSANIEWNAIKGTAEIRTPILKIATSTDALSEPVSVRLNGTVALDAAARGNMFPWQEANLKPSIAPMVFHKTKPHGDSETPWAQNGFSSLEAMEAAHQTVVAFFRDQGVSKHDRLVDLGCGNGILANMLSDWTTGVEVLEERAKAAKRRLRTVMQMSIIEWMRSDPGDYDVVLLMPGRLLEMNREDRTFAIRWLRNHAKRVVLYNYDAKLAEMCKELRIVIKWRATLSSTSVAEMVIPQAVVVR